MEFSGRGPAPAVDEEGVFGRRADRAAGDDQLRDEAAAHEDLFDRLQLQRSVGIQFVASVDPLADLELFDRLMAEFPEQRGTGDEVRFIDLLLPTSQ